MTYLGRFLCRLVVQPIGKTTTPRQNSNTPGATLWHLSVIDFKTFPKLTKTVKLMTLTILSKGSTSPQTGICQLLNTPWGVTPPPPSFGRVPFVDCVCWRLTALCELQFGGALGSSFCACLFAGSLLALGGSWRLVTMMQNINAESLPKSSKKCLGDIKIMKYGAQIQAKPIRNGRGHS